MKPIALVFLVLLLVVHSNPAGADQSTQTADYPRNAGDLKPRLFLIQNKARAAFQIFISVTGLRITSFIIEPSSDRPDSDLLSTYRELYRAASLVNRLSEAVCMDKATASLCGTTFEPKWLVYPKDSFATLASLVTWTNETERALAPLSAGLCKLAKEKTDADICARIVP